MNDPRPLGIKYFHQGLYKEALPVLLDAAVKYPQDGYVQLCLGIIFASQKNLSAAEPYLNNAARLRPNDAHAQYNLACLFHQTSRYQEAIAHYETAARLDPTLIAAKVAANNLRQSLGASSNPASPTLQQPPQVPPPYPHQPNPNFPNSYPHQSYPQPSNSYPSAAHYPQRNQGRIYNWMGFLCLILGCCGCLPIFNIAGIALSIIGMIKGDVVFGLILVILNGASLGLFALQLAVATPNPIDFMPVQPSF